eukprot:3142149-Pleurochrysis_carterae.AAC.1
MGARLRKEAKRGGQSRARSTRARRHGSSPARRPPVPPTPPRRLLARSSPPPRWTRRGPRGPPAA